MYGRALWTNCLVGWVFVIVPAIGTFVKEPFTSLKGSFTSLKVTFRKLKVVFTRRYARIYIVVISTNYPTLPTLPTP
jgi:hypothetical protein